MKIVAFASDHAGFGLKQQLLSELSSFGEFRALDLGTNSEESVDYPDFAGKAAHAVLDGAADFGVILCGSGIGISIAANRHAGIRAALCMDATMARLAREHNDANMLAMGARMIGFETAKDCLRVFLNTDFAAGRHSQRVTKLG
ncbi:MAG: ribose 5-phosphate isomerase B [Rickettsiales bacterium]|nr:ribose 5-phosphate isomerase B [Rickettsiales bacterium]